MPDKITIDQSGANTAAVESIQADSGAGARAVIAGIETMHMIKKGQLGCSDGHASSAASASYSLAF